MEKDRDNYEWAIVNDPENLPEYAQEKLLEVGNVATLKEITHIKDVNFNRSAHIWGISECEGITFENVTFPSTRKANFIDCQFINCSWCNLQYGRFENCSFTGNTRFGCYGWRSDDHPVFENCTFNTDDLGQFALLERYFGFKFTELIFQFFKNGNSQKMRIDYFPASFIVYRSGEIAEVDYHAKKKHLEKGQKGHLYGPAAWPLKIAEVMEYGLNEEEAKKFLKSASRWKWERLPWISENLKILRKGVNKPSYKKAAKSHGWSQIDSLWIPEKLSHPRAQMAANLIADIFGK